MCVCVCVCVRAPKPKSFFKCQGCVRYWFYIHTHTLARGGCVCVCVERVSFVRYEVCGRDSEREKRIVVCTVFMSPCRCIQVLTYAVVRVFVYV